jgi:hypothetical protein
MAKRDPNKTARNRIIAALKDELRVRLPQVLADVKLPSEAQLNATIGSKTDYFFDLKTDRIYSHDEFVIRWLQGLKAEVNATYVTPSMSWVYSQLKAHKSFQQYVTLFLKRSYLKHYEALSRKRPDTADAAIWIGQTNANYGLLVTPKFRDGQWVNDKSEIRNFVKPYWTIGHVLETGLVIPGKKDKIFKFSDLDQYLMFFTDTLVRNSGSQYEYAIAEHYSEFVRSQPDPNVVPLLIPEFRYEGLAKKHVYRLDFVVINPYTMEKVGFEFSPWSTHGYLAKTAGLTQQQINQMALDNFEKEMKKHREFFKKHKIYCLIYTDGALKDTKKLFQEEIRAYLYPEGKPNQLSFEVMEEFFA